MGKHGIYAFLGDQVNFMNNSGFTIVSDRPVHVHICSININFESIFETVKIQHLLYNTVYVYTNFFHTFKSTQIIA
jgi:hypothetical protein